MGIGTWQQLLHQKLCYHGSLLVRIYYKSLYHYNVGLEGRENVEDDSGNQHERKENNASEIVITKVNLDLLSRVECGEA